jgi:hypothetical protein
MLVKRRTEVIKYRIAVYKHNNKLVRFLSKCLRINYKLIVNFNFFEYFSSVDQIWSK